MCDVRELGGVGAGRKIDTNIIRTADARVITAEALANLPGLDPDGSVFARVIRSGAAKDVDSDSTFLERVPAAGERVFYHVPEELLATAAGSEFVAMQDALQLGADGVR